MKPPFYSCKNCKKLIRIFPLYTNNERAINVELGKNKPNV